MNDVLKIRSNAQVWLPVIAMIVGCTEADPAAEKAERIRQVMPELVTGELNPGFDTSPDLMSKQLDPGVRVHESANLKVLPNLKSANGGKKWNGLFESEETIEVYPTGLSLQDIPVEERCPDAGPDCTPSDAQLVQAAINDLGSRSVNGTVLLKATNLAGEVMSFNFGFAYPRERICIVDTDVWLYGCLTLPSPAQSGHLELRGEILASGERATIAGGHSPIFFGRASYFVARNLRLEDAWVSGIMVAKQNGSLIKGNEIISTDFNGSAGIGVVKIYGGDADYITGHVVIQDNLIDDTTSISRYFGAIGTLNGFISAEIKDNVILNAADGISVLWFRDDHVVKGNTIVTRNYPAFGWSTAGVTNCRRHPDATVQYKGNIVTAEADGFIVYAQASKGDEGPSEPCPITNSQYNGNDMTMLNVLGDSEPNAAFWIASVVFDDGEIDPEFIGRIQDNEFKDNVINGSSEFAFWAGNYDLAQLFGALLKEELSGNEFTGNDLSGFTLAPDDAWGLPNAHMYFSSTSHDNTYDGCAGETAHEVNPGTNTVKLPSCP